MEPRSDDVNSLKLWVIFDPRPSLWAAACLAPYDILHRGAFPWVLEWPPARRLGMKGHLALAVGLEPWAHAADR